MSNEKPVRITVGDVKEVTEATTVQSEVVKETVSYASTSTPSVDTTSNALVVIGAIIGILLFIIGGYLALGSGGVSAANANNAAITAPAANNSASNTATDTNTSAANNAPANANNVAPAADNAP